MGCVDLNFWVTMYLIFAPLFVGFALLFFNRAVLVKYWWLYKHPQSVYKAVFFYDNRIFSEKFVSTLRGGFDFNGGLYNIKKEAVLRKNWLGMIPKTKIPINADNCLHFEHYKVYHKERFSDVPDKAQLVGELHYIYGFPDPIIYPSASQIMGTKTLDVDGFSVVNTGKRSAEDYDRVQKNSVLDQLLSAQFKQITLTVIIIVMVICLLLLLYLVALRVEMIKTPLHAVCVNLPGVLTK